jgi:predicted phosphodiesterase
MRTLLKELGISDAQLARMLSGKKRKAKVIKRHITERSFEFGIVSDTHFCSTEEKLNELETFYQICEKEGITEVFHAGDLVAGWGIYPGQENEVHTFGAANQAQYVINNYPKRKDIQTYFITGNHCLSFWKRSGIDIGVIVDKERRDMHYLGQYQGDIELGGVKIRLLHPDGGGAYAISYKGQKICEQIPSGQKPQILILGHFHTAVYFHYRLIHVFQAG